jgi:hypothetical protein
MVELSVPHPTIDAINAHYEKHQDVRLPQRLTARLLASNCERQGWYAFRWARDPKRFPGSIVRSNLARQQNMDELVASLSDAGVKVQRVDPKTFMAIDVIAADGHYRQKITGTVEGLLEAPKTVHLLYADQQPAKAFAQIVKHGLAIGKPDRIPALQIGMHLLGLTRSYYLVRNKDTDELHSERIEHDAVHAMTLLAKAERIRDANQPAARVSDDPNWFECKFCPAFDLCHAGEFALRNCRTCLHSSPVAGGGWQCVRHNRPIGIDEQALGCPQHLFLPGLVPGEQVDADPANETVTYELARGGAWVDGAERSVSP